VNKIESKPGSTVTPQRIMGMAWGYSAPLIMEAAIKHKVFDVLDSGAKTADEVARATGVSLRGVRIIMNAMVALELLSKSGDRYSLAPESAAFLVSTKPSFQGGIFKHISEQLLPSWMKLDEIVRTGKPPRAVNDELKGAKFFEQFVEDIFPMSYAAAQTLAKELKIAESKQPVKVLDIAAGSGVWGIALAQASPQVRITAVDWPRVTPVTQRVAKKHGIAADRLTIVNDDLHDVDFGSGHTIATLGHILHSEGERRSRALLKKVFNALAPGGTIAIAEFVANDDRTGPVNAMIFAVNMLVNTDEGDTFTFPEMSGWLREAEFTNARTIESPGPSPLLLATRPA
jgi:predicted O-methyltransferase YrrM